MQDNKSTEIMKSKNKEVGAFKTFALAGGKKNPRTGTTIPAEEGVEEAKKFVEDNKK